MPTDRNNIMKNPDGIFRWAGWHSVTYTGCHLFCIAPNSPYTVSAGPSVRPAETLCVSRPFSGNSECPPRADPCVRPRGNPSPLHPPPANSQCSLQADIQILTHGQIETYQKIWHPAWGIHSGYFDCKPSNRVKLPYFYLTSWGKSAILRELLREKP